MRNEKKNAKPTKKDEGKREDVTGENQGTLLASGTTDYKSERSDEELAIRREYDQQLREIILAIDKAKEEKKEVSQKIAELKKSLDRICKEILCIHDSFELPLFKDAEAKTNSNNILNDDVQMSIQNVTELRANNDISFDFDVFDSLSVKYYENCDAMTECQKQTIIDIADVVETLVSYKG